MMKLRDWLDKKKIPYTLDSEGFITVKGNLDLNSTKNMDCSKLAKVGGYLFIGNSFIEELPNLKTIKDYLYANNSFIKELPKLKTVGSFLYLKNSLLLKNKGFITKMMLLGKTFNKENDGLE